jgi:hypothetical protein
MKVVDATAALGAGVTDHLDLTDNAYKFKHRMYVSVSTSGGPGFPATQNPGAVRWVLDDQAGTVPSDTDQLSDPSGGTCIYPVRSNTTQRYLHVKSIINGTYVTVSRIEEHERD